MAGKYRKVSRGDPFRFPAMFYNDLVDVVSRPVNQQPGLASQFMSGTVVVPVKNISGSDRSRWDCMSLGELRTTWTDAGTEAHIFDVDTANANKDAAILQQPIADGKLGRAAIFGYTPARLAQATDASHRWGTPAAASHNLTVSDSGPIKILSAPSTTDPSLRPVLLGFGSTSEAEAEIHIARASSTITARSGDTAGSGTANLVSISGAALTESANEETIYNLAPHALPDDIYLMIVKEKSNGQFIAQHPGIIDLRLNGANLQYTYDGVTWNTWETTTVCP